jgi:mRNA interferase MazF
VAEFVGGDVVVVPFPFTDLQSSKRRPAVVLATFARGDLLICQNNESIRIPPDRGGHRHG